MIHLTTNPAAPGSANRVRNIKAWTALDVLNLIERLARTQARSREQRTANSSNLMRLDAERKEYLA